MEKILNTANWDVLWMFIRIIVACLCGAVIGLERTKRMKEAGIRTHIIVCCASALLMLVSKYAFGDLFEGAADAARIAAQVVSGISFLCAGVIFKNGNSIKGLTTAAGIWFTAAVGLAVGAGMYLVGLFATLVIMLLQFLMHRFTFGNDSLITEQVRITVDDNGVFTPCWNAFLEETSATVEDMKIKQTREGIYTYKLCLRSTNSITSQQWQSLIENCSGISELEHEVAS